MWEQWLDGPGVEETFKKGVVQRLHCNQLTYRCRLRKYWHCNVTPNAIFTTLVVSIPRTPADAVTDPCWNWESGPDLPVAVFLSELFLGVWAPGHLKRISFVGGGRHGGKRVLRGSNSTRSRDLGYIDRLWLVTIDTRRTRNSINCNYRFGLKLVELTLVNNQSPDQTQTNFLDTYRLDLPLVTFLAL